MGIGRSVLILISGCMSLWPQETAWKTHLSNAENLRRGGDLTAARGELSLAMAGAGDRLAKAHVLDAMGMLQDDAGNFAEAESCLKRSLSIWQQYLGPEHFGLVRVINQLAAVYVETGQIGKAARLDLETWAQRLAGNPAAQADLVPLLQNLGTLDSLRGRAAGAEARFRQALDLLPTREASVERAVLLNNWGLASVRLSRYDAAIEHLRRSTAIWEEVRGPWDRNRGLALHALGIACTAAGRLEEAEPYLRNALAISERSFGASNVRTAAILQSYAVLLRKLHRNGEAREMSARSGRISRESLLQSGSGSVVDVSELSAKPGPVRD